MFDGLRGSRKHEGRTGDVEACCADSRCEDERRIPDGSPRALLALFVPHKSRNERLARHLALLETQIVTTQRCESTEGRGVLQGKTSLCAHPGSRKRGITLDDTILDCVASVTQVASLRKTLRVLYGSRRRLVYSLPKAIYETTETCSIFVDSKMARSVMSPKIIDRTTGLIE